MARRIRRLVVVANLVYAAVLLILGLVPDVPMLATGISDHAAHALAYAVQAGLLFALFLPLAGRGPAALLAGAGAVIYGGVVETLQLLQPSRTAEIFDLAANAIGAGLTASIAFLLTPRRETGDGR